MPKPKPVVLLILDGWGYRENIEHNAIAAANTPNWDQWWTHYPHTLLHASGHFVGLPDSQMGNSEVGHMHIGAGRILPQDFTRINQAIEDGSFYKNPVLLSLIERVQQSKGTLHIMGLLSPGGVHSHEKHLFAFLKLCQAHALKKICLHLFLDGRDTPPKSALSSLDKLNALLSAFPEASIGSISGRYYAMDRDKRWERIQKEYELLTENKTPYQFATVSQALEYFYSQDISDEFVPPTMIGAGQNIQDGDAIFFFNYRADRARQLCQALAYEKFDGFKRKTHPKVDVLVTLTQYLKELTEHVAFPPVTIKNTLGEVLSKNGLHQLRAAETEKYAHVTFFLNGGVEEPYPNESRFLMPSPAVATYDLKPEMSANELTHAIVEAIEENQFDVLICNYANADMVGHTGNFEATVRAIECLDQCMQKIKVALDKVGGAMLITADHGNAELMHDPHTDQPQTSHTELPVPLLFIGEGWHFNSNEGSLIDISPSLLSLLEITPPKEMTGRPLLVKNP